MWYEGFSVALLSDVVVVDDADGDGDATLGFFLGSTLGGESNSSGKLNPGFVFPYFLAVLSYTRAASSSSRNVPRLSTVFLSILILACHCLLVTVLAWVTLLTPGRKWQYEYWLRRKQEEEEEKVSQRAACGLDGVVCVE